MLFSLLFGAFSLLFQGSIGMKESFFFWWLALPFSTKKEEQDIGPCTMNFHKETPVEPMSSAVDVLCG